MQSGFLALFLLIVMNFPLQAVLRVGMELTYPPFEMVCPNGEPCGIGVEMAKSLGKYLNEEIQIENRSFVGLLPALQTGKIDLILSSMTRTAEREKVVDFSNPYATIGLALLVSKGSDLPGINEANSSHYTIVVKSGTSGEVYARHHLQKATIRVLDKEASCVLEIVQAKADAFIYDQLSVYTQWQKNKNTTRALLEAFQEEKWAIAVRKGNIELLNKINAFLIFFKNEGGFTLLSERYLKEQQLAFEKMHIPFLFSE